MFGLTEEQKQLQSAVRAFAEREVAPHVSEWDEKSEFPHEVVKKLGEMGLLGVIFPESLGGAGMGYVEYVLAIEELSRILPDHTYVTELRIEGNKLRLVGITRDAPSLIGLIEQSARFSRATFFAPTTRLPSDQGERFHIEVQLQPLVSARS